MTRQYIDQYYTLSGSGWRRGSAVLLALLLHGVIMVGIRQWAAAAQVKHNPQPVFTVLNLTESPVAMLPSTPPVKWRQVTTPVTVPVSANTPQHSKRRTHKAAATAHVIEDQALQGNESRSTAVEAPQAHATAAKQVAPNTAPSYLDQPLPSYPAVARRRGLQGVVLLDVDVAADGRPLKVTVLRSSGYAVLDDAARAAVHNWHFMPARHRGQSVRASVQVPIRFHLNGGAS